IKLGNFAPRDWVQLQVLYNEITPTITNIRAKNGSVMLRQIIINPRLPNVIYLLTGILILIGAAVCVGAVGWAIYVGATNLEHLIIPTGSTAPSIPTP
ncbi:MAG: hypothetical protein ABMA14_17825, partial [Hyphomonadaceae bacterium]